MIANLNAKHRITVYEHERLYASSGDKGFTTTHLTALEKFHGDGVPYFSLIRNGVKFCQFVGVLQVGDLVIEVLPKADGKSNGDGEDTWRKRLIGMLKAVGVFDVRAPSNSALRLQPNHILELYFALFLEQLEYLLHTGLVKRYHKTEGNATALKGSLHFPRHIQQNLVHQERFYVRHTTYDTEHQLHAILWKTLRLLRRINSSPALHGRIGALLLNFPEQPDVTVTAATFERIVYNRKTEHYRSALEIARLLLLHYHPDVSSGRDHVLALMFDMNRLWEKFVYVSLRKHLQPRGYEVYYQQPVKPFWQPKGGSSVTMQPDIVVKYGSRTFVLDAKWKNLDGQQPSPDDLRQLFAYHLYYQAEKTAIVYPGSEAAIPRGAYTEVNWHKQQINDLECSLIAVQAQKGIAQWQEDICQRIGDWAGWHWPIDLKH